MRSVGVVGVLLIAVVWASEAQEFSGTIRILKSSDRVKIGGRSYKVKRTKGNALASDRNGSCVFEGQLFRHGGNVQRKDACDKCMCFSSEVLCWKTLCPQMKVAKGCREVRHEGVCCPVVECDPTVPLKKHQTFSVKKQRPFVPTKLNRHKETTECEVDGYKFRYGQIVPQASGACMECRCGFEGQMKCKTRKCHLTGVLDLGKVARVTHNTKQASKPPVIIHQRDPSRSSSY
ncbi:hypothetical protein BIW11_09261 [Tropilaelaps mercedesae]|uniref:VWFC domain-containing protein n=1 Tax=Tropilaelaps mercedesae TaxID=418985 RepID=A0A1V9XKU1_9ACAR|nr:hypothetical protein BIW11_09261 [Tropilaelaps mercedesae]